MRAPRCALLNMPTPIAIIASPEPDRRRQDLRLHGVQGKKRSWVSHSNVRWLFFGWALLATIGMFVASTRMLEFVGGWYKDAPILFGWASILGAPAWITIGVFSAVRWRHIPLVVKVVQNFPALLGAILYVVVVLSTQRDSTDGANVDDPDYAEQQR
jgi:hypothetical protein